MINSSIKKKTLYQQDSNEMHCGIIRVISSFN